jgi:hypothetical protein
VTVRRSLVAVVGALLAWALFFGGGDSPNRLAWIGGAAIVAAALVVAAELAFLSLRPHVAPGDARARWDPPLRILAIALATLVGGGIVLVGSGASGGGLVLEGVGVASAVVAVALVVALAARSRDRVDVR